MRSLVRALMMTAGALTGVAAPGQGSNCIAPSEGARIETTAPASSTVRLEWRIPAEATKVRLQLSADPEFGKRLIDREVCCEARLRGLDVGLYHWRVMDVEADAEVCRSSFEVVALPKE